MMLAGALLQTSLLLWTAQQTLQGGLRPQAVAYGRMLPNRGAGLGVGIKPGMGGVGALGAVANRYNTKAMKNGLGRHPGAQLGAGSYRSLGLGGRAGLKPGYGQGGGYGASLGAGMLGPGLSNGHGLGLGQAGKRGYGAGLGTGLVAGGHGAGLGTGLGTGLVTGLGTGLGAHPGGYGAMGGLGVPGGARQGLVGSPDLGIHGVHGAVKGPKGRHQNPYAFNPVRSNIQYPSTLEIQTDTGNRPVVGDMRGLEMTRSMNIGTAIDKPGKGLGLAGQGREDYLPIAQRGVSVNQGLTHGHHLKHPGLEKDIRNLPLQQNARDVPILPIQRPGKNCNKGLNDQLGIIQQSEMLRSQGLGSQGLGSQGLGSQSLGSQGLGSQGLGSHGLGSQGLGSQGLGSQGLGSHGLGSQGLGSHGLGSQGLGSHGLGSQGLGSQGLGSHGLGLQFPIDKSLKYHGHAALQTQGENSPHFQQQPFPLPDEVRAGVFSMSQGQTLPGEAIRDLGLVGKSTDKLQAPQTRISIGIESGQGAANLHIQGVEGNRQGAVPGALGGAGAAGAASAHLGLGLAEEQKSISKEGKHLFHEGRDVREPKALPGSTVDNTQGPSYLGGQGNYLGASLGAGGYGTGGYLGGAAGKLAAGYGDGMTGYGAMGANGYGGDVRGLVPGYANGYGDGYGAALGTGAFPGQLPGAGYGALGTGLEAVNGKYGGAAQLPYGGAPVIPAGLEGEGGYPYTQPLGLEPEGAKSAKSYGDQIAKFTGGTAPLVNGYKG